MPHLRFDHTTSDWVVFAPLRSFRPSTRKTDAPPAPSGGPATCPFCPGNERMTPHEIDAIRSSERDQPDWHIRILPRLATAAGFELGSGMSINTVLPEEAARFLRGGNHTSHESVS